MLHDMLREKIEGSGLMVEVLRISAFRVRSKFRVVGWLWVGGGWWVLGVGGGGGAQDFLHNHCSGIRQAGIMGRCTAHGCAEVCVRGGTQLCVHMCTEMHACIHTKLISCRRSITPKHTAAFPIRPCPPLWMHLCHQPSNALTLLSRRQELWLRTHDTNSNLADTVIVNQMQ